MSTQEQLTTARLELQRIATHILARARYQSDGRFGLRVTPSGIGTPSFGPQATILRIAGPLLVREFQSGDAPRTESMELTGHSLSELARFAGVNLHELFAAGADTPMLGSVEVPVAIESDPAAEVMAWHRLGAEALDRVLPSVTEASIAQLWPEHFDVAFDVLTPHGRVNLGASPGDLSHPEPYLYVAPWGDERPGDPEFWNAPFGAVLARGQGVDDAQQAALFLERGLAQLEK